jgi:hypothetical protein
MIPDAQPAGDHSPAPDTIEEFKAATNPNAVPLSEWIAEDPQPPQKPPWQGEGGGSEQPSSPPVR